MQQKWACWYIVTLHAVVQTSGDSSPCSSISSLSTEALRYLERHPHVMRKPGHQQQLLQSVQSNATPPMRRPVGNCCTAGYPTLACFAKQSSMMLKVVHRRWGCEHQMFWEGVRRPSSDGVMPC